MRDLANWISSDTRWFEAQTGLELESGERLAEWQLAYRTWGELNSTGDNVVMVCHALTGSADADEWWSGLFGQGRALDPSQDFVVCSNVIGGCYGSTGPRSAKPGDERSYGAQFPRVSIRDMVAAQRHLVDHLGVKRLKLVLGPSLGGMQVLEWASLYPEVVEAIAPVGVSARHSAWCIGTSEAQRQAIFRDPKWLGGNYEADKPPADGFAVARMMAMLSYRSWENFESRFARQQQPDTQEFTIASYLRYQGDKIVQRFDPLSYVRLTEAMDTHDLARGRGEEQQALARLRMPALVVAVTSDVLYPPQEQEYLAAALPNAQLRYLESPAGHDGFLIDTDELSDMIVKFRQAQASVPSAAVSG